MASVSYGNTLTDLGRNIAEQKASSNALAGILAQVGAQKLAALNALAANRGRTAADREVGLDRNATMRESAVLEAMLKGQELSDRDRQYQAQIQAAQELARMQGANNLQVAEVPFGVNAQTMAGKLAEIARMQVAPRVQETMFTENAERERQNIKAKNLAADANRRASLAFQEFQRRMGSWTPIDTDRDIQKEYNDALDVITKLYGDDASLIRPVTRPGGKVEFEAMVLPQIMPPVPQVQQPTTGNTNAVPPPNMAVPQLPGIAPSPAPPMAVPRPGVADLRMADEMAVPGVAARNVTDAASAMSREASGLTDLSRGILAQSPFKELIPESVFADANIRGGRRFGARTPDEQESILRGYVNNLLREAGRLAGMPAARGADQRANLLRAELARVRSILSSQ